MPYYVAVTNYASTVYVFLGTPKIMFLSKRTVVYQHDNLANAIGFAQLSNYCKSVKLALL